MHSIKILGVAIVAMLGMSVAASAAQAASFTASASGLSLSGSQVTKFVFTTGAGSTTCSSASFAGTTTATSSTTQTITASYSSCTTGGAFVDDVSMTSCAYVASAGGAFAIVCSVIGDTIDLTVTDGSKASLCTQTYPAQSLSGLTFTSAAPGMTIGFKITGLKYTIDGSKCAKPAGTYSDGTLSGSMSFKPASGSTSVDTP